MSYKTESIPFINGSMSSAQIVKCFILLIVATQSLFHFEMRILVIIDWHVKLFVQEVRWVFGPWINACYTIICVTKRQLISTVSIIISISYIIFILYFIIRVIVQIVFLLVDISFDWVTGIHVIHWHRVDIVLTLFFLFQIFIFIFNFKCIHYIVNHRVTYVYFLTLYSLKFIYDFKP